MTGSSVGARTRTSEATQISSIGVDNPEWQSNSAPTIGEVRPSAGSETRDHTPTIAATVSDKQTNLAKANMTLSLDGSAVSRRAFSYDTATDRLSYTPSRELSFGKHAVKIGARDEIGLRATNGWSFKVVR
jgi:fibronectin type 3 domain-containing protein